MPIQVPGLPFRLTPEDLGVPNIPSAVGAGGSAMDKIIAARLSQAKARSASTYADFMPDQFWLKGLANPAIASHIPEDARRRLLDGMVAHGMAYEDAYKLVYGDQGDSSSSDNRESAHEPERKDSGYDDPYVSNDPEPEPAPQPRQVGNFNDRPLSKPAEPNPSAIGGGGGDSGGGGGGSPMSLLDRVIQSIMGGGGGGSGGGGASQMPPVDMSTEIPAKKPWNQMSWEEQEADYRRTTERGAAEGKKEGDLRAEQLADLGQQLFTGRKVMHNLDMMQTTADSPVFRSMRNVPILGQHELGWYAMKGSKEQKEAVGDLINRSNQLVIDTAQMFKGMGQFRTGEQAVIEKGKVNTGDMPDVIAGKIKAQREMFDFGHRMSRSVHDIMRSNPDIDMYTASEMTYKKMGAEDFWKVQQNELKKLEKQNNLQKMRSQGYKEMRDTSGKRHLVHPDDVDQALKEKWQF